MSVAAQSIYELSEYTQNWDSLGRFIMKRLMPFKVLQTEHMSLSPIHGIWCGTKTFIYMQRQSGRPVLRVYGICSYPLGRGFHSENESIKGIETAK
jgi:hypothetical protein